MARDTPRLTITLPPELAEQVRAHAGPGEVSSWLATAAAERLQREQLAEAIADFEAEHGEITADDVAAARARTLWQPAGRAQGSRSDTSSAA